jgi:hypothetical protein
MSTKITWGASTDPNIASYTLQYSADVITWSALTSVTHTIPGPNWDAVNSVFYYVHVAGTQATWYRLQAVDSVGQTSDWSASFQAGAIYYPRWGTVQEIVSDAAIEVGLTAPSDVMASTDPNIAQLCRLLKSSGRDLIHMRSWTHLRKEHSLTTVAGVANYSLPSDYHNMIDQTWWNRTNRLPVGGPLSAQEWQYLKARMVGVVFNVLFRPMDRLISLYPDTNTPAGYNIVFEYSSAWWISQTGSPDVATGDFPTLSSDYVWFDPTLTMRKLKLEFLKAKGFDTTAAQQDYDMTLELVKGHDSPAAIINLNKSNLGMRDPPIGGQSVPITGFGGP